MVRYHPEQSRSDPRFIISNSTPIQTPISLEFSFHNVGQGLFYSGLLNDFCFVYDCGSYQTTSANLQSVVSKFVNARNSRIINLLIISHFDYDHISGLNQLLASCTPQYVVVPYLNPIGDFDLIIACIALEFGEPLATRNATHFETVPGLKIETW